MKYTLITGASRGIGLAMAECCASKGFNLVMTARSEEALNENAAYLMKKYKIDAKVFYSDLLEPNSAESIYNFCIEQNLTIDKLINNAGVGVYGRFNEHSIEEYANLVQLNIVATMKMSHRFIPMLMKNSQGYLMNVAGTSGYQPIPYMGIFAASHAFIQSFTLALREELCCKRISVSCLCPGPTATDFYERAGISGLPVNSSEVKMAPNEVAEIGIKGMLAQVAEIIPGANNTLGAYFSKVLPNKWIVKTVGGLFSPKAA